MTPMSVLLKPASGNCNMNCDYCFYCDEQNNRKLRSYGYMDEDTLKNVMRKTLLHSQGSCTFAFQGGEPTLVGLEFFENVIKYEKIYNKNNLRVFYALQTNGTKINEDWCRFLKKNNFLVGLSVDGTKTTNDTFRHVKDGVSAYDCAEKAANLMDFYEVDYNILTVVHKKTVNHAAEIYHEYKRKRWGFQQYIACLDPLFKEPGKNEFSLLSEDYGKFLVILFEQWFNDLKKNQQPYIRQFENYIAILLGYYAESCDQRGTCGIQYVIEADGSVFPCDFYMLDEYYLGNFNNSSIKEIDDKRTEINFVKKSNKLSQNCSSCEYFYVCKGGCRRNRVEFQDGTYSNYLCEGYKLFFKTCLSSLISIADIVRINSNNKMI